MQVDVNHTCRYLTLAERFEITVFQSLQLLFVDKDSVLVACSPITFTAPYNHPIFWLRTFSLTAQEFICLPSRWSLDPPHAQPPYTASAAPRVAAHEDSFLHLEGSF